ncbi:MAG: RNA polymerase factor sigma-54 [Geminicoccaceae bacterium]|nr:RNA polymerase factor sigma-54 [Geminicoccaceae bacterium]
MTLTLRLDVKQTQGLVLTPQLQQAIRLLQLSSQELQGEVAREIMENPFLTLAEPLREVAAHEAAAGGARTAAGPVDADDSWAPPAAPAAADSRLGLKHTTSGAPDDDLPALEQRLTQATGLRAHLRQQLCASGAPRERRLAADVLVDWLDEDGYLREADGQIATALGLAPAAVAEARGLLQGLDPCGIAARDLAECLALQLKEKDRLDPAMQALLRHLERVARAEWSQLERLCRVDREDLEEMVGELRALDPRPGRGFPGDHPVEILPDVVVASVRPGVWRIELNPHVLPRLVVEGDYHAEVARHCAEQGQKAFVTERFQSANWLAKALQQRSRTILKVAKAIFTRQQGFLEQGPHGLRPLILRDIAAATGLHESTVSRATSEKYVQTPHGTFALKYFFTTAIQASEDGEDHSAEAIRQQIRRFVQQEDASDVLSDDQIVALLKAEGVVIARRTIAKYREAMGIPSSVARRRAKSMPR